MVNVNFWAFPGGVLSSVFYSIRSSASHEESKNVINWLEKRNFLQDWTQSYRKFYKQTTPWHNPAIWSMIMTWPKLEATQQFGFIIFVQDDQYQNK